MALDCKCERSAASLIEYVTFEKHIRMFCFRNPLFELCDSLLLGSLMTPAVAAFTSSSHVGVFAVCDLEFMSVLVSVAKIILLLQGLSDSSLGGDSRLIRYSGNFLSVLALQPLPLPLHAGGGSLGAPGRQDG